MQRLWRRIAAFLLGSFLPFLSPSSYLPPSHPCHSQAFRVFLKAWLVLINTHTKGEINCPVYDCFYYLAGGRHDQNHHKYSFKKSIAMHPPDYFSSLLGICDTVNPQYAEEIQQGLCSVRHQCVFKNYSGNRYLHFVPDSALRDVSGRAPFDCWRSPSWSWVFLLLFRSTPEITHPAVQGTVFAHWQ